MRLMPHLLLQIMIDPDAGKDETVLIRPDISFHRCSP